LNTQTTRKTSKNRRREERKRARGKKGSIYEAEYLVNSLGRLVERINSVNEDVGRLVDGLMRRSMREQARATENAMTEMVDLCNQVVLEAFESKPKDAPHEANITKEVETPTEANGILYNAMDSAREPISVPIVKKFERLSLLE
jgi:elongator complex protein 1